MHKEKNTFNMSFNDECKQYFPKFIYIIDLNGTDSIIAKAYN